MSGPLENAFDKLQRLWEPCPDAETLARHAHAEIVGAEQDRLAQHVSQCGVCEALLMRMRAFETEETPDHDWQDFEKRSSARFRAAFKGKLPVVRRAGGSSPLLRIIWNPIPAYLIAALALLYLGVHNRATRLPPVVRSTGLEALALQNARILRLDSTRGAIKTEERAANSSDRVVVLSFFVPVREGLRYAATVKETAGKAVAQLPSARSYNDRGDFLIACDRSAFPSGGYVLTVAETDSTGHIIRVFDFPFSL